jgi:hypothetical protein
MQFRIGVSLYLGAAVLSWAAEESKTAQRLAEATDLVSEIMGAPIKVSHKIY